MRTGFLALVPLCCLQVYRSECRPNALCGRLGLLEESQESMELGGFGHEVGNGGRGSLEEVGEGLGGG